VGYAFLQEYELLNATGDTLAEVDADAAPVLGVSVALSF
jgi:hypothetical protein